MQKKEKKEPIKLTDALVISLGPKDGEWISDTTPGLKLRIRPGISRLVRQR